MARKLKKATPPAMIGMLSALCSAHDRLTICFHPAHGIWVGFSAWMPGSSCGLGDPGGGRSGSPLDAGVPSFAAFAAAARRAAFSSTRSRMRSTALSRCLVPAMTLPPGAGRRPAACSMSVHVPAGTAAPAGTSSVARPGAGELLEPARTGPIDGGLGGGEDRAVDRRGEHGLPHPVLALQRGGGLLLVGDDLPDLLEKDPAQRAGHQAGDQADRPVGDLGPCALAGLTLVALAQRFLPRSPFDVARFRRKITTPTTRPASARTAPITTGGLSR